MSCKPPLSYNYKLFRESTEHLTPGNHPSPLCSPELPELPFILPSVPYLHISISSKPILDACLPSLMTESPFRFPLSSPEGEAAEKLCMLAGFYCGAHRDHRPADWRIPPKRQKRESLFEALCLSTEASLLFQMKFLCYQQRGKLCGHSCGHLGDTFPANHLNFYPSLYFNSSYPSLFLGSIP